MKIKEGFVIQDIGGEAIAVYTGEDENGLKGIVKLNRLGVFLWDRLTEGCTMEKLVEAVTRKYDVDKKQALSDAEAFVDSLRGKNILED